MPAASAADLARMREQLLFDGPNVSRKLSRFWTLVALSAVIAAAGIVGDSTATVIGAMIVAPLMTPILGTVLSVARRREARRRHCFARPRSRRAHRAHRSLRRLHRIR